MTNTPAATHVLLNLKSCSLQEVRGLLRAENKCHLLNKQAQNIPLSFPMQEENFSIPKMNACLYSSTPDRPLCFILALKVCEGVLNIAYNIYTSRLSPKDRCLNGPLGEAEVGREGTTASRHPPAFVASCTCANYSLMDRQRSLTSHNCLADAIHKCFTPA